jgi:hypothetical protein
MAIIAHFERAAIETVAPRTKAEVMTNVSSPSPRHDRPPHGQTPTCETSGAYRHCFYLEGAEAGAGATLVACRLAGISALEAHYVGLVTPAQCWAAALSARRKKAR